MANVVVSALATWNGKALRKAKQDVSVFNKQLQGLARTFGVAFSAAAIVSFSKKAVKAFAADELAAKSLALQLQNTGNAFRVTEVENYVKGLEKTYAILTDLRTPFKTLLNVTGSVDLAQRSLEAALNISAGTGENLNTVVGAISAGVRGQTKAIKGLNTGIDESIIATGDMNKIMAALEKRFAGQAAARLNTYAGKMDVLAKGADEATKSIGRGLVDALTILGEDNSVAGLATDFENLGDNIGYAVVQLAKLLDKAKGLTNSPSFKPLILLAGVLGSAATGNPLPLVGAFGAVGAMGIGGALTKDYGTKAKTNAGGYSGIPDLRTAKLLLKARKDEYDLITKKNAVENKNVEELKKKFDLERIGLTQALNLATDEETKLRLQAQLAILDNNDALAKKLLAELQAAEALKKLAEQAAAAGKSLTEFALIQVRSLTNRINAQIESIQEMFGMSKSPGTSSGGQIVYPPLTTEFYSGQQDIVNPLAGTYYGETGRDPMPIEITVNTASTGDRFAQLIAESLQVATKSGISYGIAGGLAV